MCRLADRVGAQTGADCLVAGRVGGQTGAESLATGRARPESGKWSDGRLGALLGARRPRRASSTRVWKTSSGVEAGVAARAVSRVVTAPGLPDSLGLAAPGAGPVTSGEGGLGRLGQGLGRLGQGLGHERLGPLGQGRLGGLGQRQGRLGLQGRVCLGLECLGLGWLGLQGQRRLGLQGQR